MLQAEIKVSSYQELGYKTENKPAHDLFVLAVDDEHPLRQRVENYIKQGFAENHGARVRSFMPYLIALKDDKVRSALGIRPATEPLFLEQYLDLPIEKVLAIPGLKRSDIVEIGNLVSDNRRHTLLLFLILGMALARSGYKEIVFCATHKVASILQKAGAKLSRIVEADGQRLGNSLSEWGAYYDHNPVLMRLNIASVLAIVEFSPLLKYQCAAYEADIDSIAKLIVRKAK